MKTVDILMKPRYLKAENEALEACIHHYETMMPHSPISAHLRDRIKQNEQTIAAMEAWLEAVPDVLIKTAIKAYQRNGDWSAACGYGSPYTLRMTVSRYLERTEFMTLFG